MVRGRVPGAERLDAGGPGLQLPAGACSSTAVGAPVNTSCSVGDQPLLGEVQRVGRGQQREQPALVHAVVEQQLLRRPAPGSPNWRRLLGVLDRDGQRDLGGVDRRAADADPALHQGAEHGEEAPVGFSIAAGVACRPRRPRRSGRAASVARHPHVVEPEPAVVDAVEADLGAAVLDAHAGQRRRPARRGSAPRTRARRAARRRRSSWAKTTAIRPCAAALPM